MPFEEKIDVLEENLAELRQEVLNILLKYRTKDRNIMWAISDYIKKGEGYGVTDLIYSRSITGDYSKPYITSRRKNARIKE